MNPPADPPSPFRLEPEELRPAAPASAAGSATAGAAAGTSPATGAGAAGELPAGGLWPALRVGLVGLGVFVAMALPLEWPWQRAVVAGGVLLAVVGLWPPRGASAAPAGRLTLGMGAAAAVLGPFMYANPWVGVDALDWPWTYWQDARRWVDRVDLLAWGALAAAAVGAAVSCGRALAAAALTLAFLVMARGHAQAGALSLVRMERVNLIWTIAATVFAGAAVHLARSGTARRGIARALLASSCLVIVAVYAAWFPEGGRGLRSSLAYYADELPPMFQSAFGAAEADAVYREAAVRQAWALGIPFLLQALAVALGLGLALVPSRARVVRHLAALAVGAMLATWLVPARAGLWFVAEAQGAVSATKLAQQVGETTMKAGLAAWLVGAGAVVALLGRGAPAPGAPPAGPRGRWPYLGVAVAAAGTLTAAFHPEWGLEVRRWAFDVLADGRWTQAVALAAVRAGLVVVPFALAWGRPGVVRGGLAAFAAVLGIATLSTAGATWFAGVDRWVVPAAGAVAVGAAGGTRPGSRGLATAAAAVVLVLMLYPMPVSARVAGDGSVTAPYTSGLVDDALLGIVEGAERGVLVERLLYPPFVAVAGLVLSAVAALVAAATRARVAGQVARVAYVVVFVLAPPVLGATVAPGGSASLSAGAALLACAHGLLEFLAVPLTLLALGVRDLTRGGPPPPGAVRPG